MKSKPVIMRKKESMIIERPKLKERHPFARPVQIHKKSYKRSKDIDEI